jgi:hypothetical protein
MYVFSQLHLKKVKQKEIYLFSNTDVLQEAIKFYGNFKHKNVNYSKKFEVENLGTQQ